MESFLSQFQQIEELSLSHRLFTPYLRSPKINIPFLRRLSISTVHYLLVFDTPLLEELHTGIRYWPKSLPPFEGAISSLKRHHLKQLSLSINSLHKAKNVLQNVSNTIQDLCLGGVDLTTLKNFPLPQYSVVRSVKSLTIELKKFEDVEQAEFLDLVKSWQIQSNLPSGFGPFETLQRFTLIVHTGNRKRSSTGGLESFTRSLKEIFEERGVQCGVQQIGSSIDAHLSICRPQFEAF